MAPRTSGKWVMWFIASTTPVLAEWEGLPMPESPAAAAIGTADTTILKPSTAKDLAASLIRVASRGGKITSGINLEFAPSTLLRGTRYTQAREYTSASAPPVTFGPLAASLPFSPTWILTNTTVSLATGAKEGSSTSTDKIALGLKVPLYDHADPRLSAAECYRSLKARFARAEEQLAEADKSRSTGMVMVSSESAPRTVADRQELQATANQALRLCISEKPWNAPSAALAFAQVWTDLGTEEKARLTRDARYGWFSIASPLGTATSPTPQPGEMQLVIQAKLARDVVDTTKSVPAGAAPIRYRGDAGALRFRAGEDKLNVDLSGSIERRRYTDGTRDNVRLGALGLELRVMENLWVKLSLGYERKDITGGNPFVNTSFKWGTNKEADGNYFAVQRAVDPQPAR